MRYGRDADRVLPPARIVRSKTPCSRTGPQRRPAGAVRPEILREQTVRALAAGDGFIPAIRELLLVRLLRAASEFGEMEREVVPIFAEQGWRSSSGAELTRDMLSFESWEAIRPMNLPGIVHAGRWPDRRLRLTHYGPDGAPIAGAAPPLRSTAYPSAQAVPRVGNVSASASVRSRAAQTVRTVPSIALLPVRALDGDGPGPGPAKLRGRRRCRAGHASPLRRTIVRSRRESQPLKMAC